MSIGQNIKSKREAMRLTQAELAEKVSVNQSLICQFERGTKVPTLPLGKEIADALECSIDSLLAE